MSGDEAAPEPAGLRGRGSECASLDDLVVAVRAGGSRTLVVHGEAGIGKTALLDYVAASAVNVRVLRATGVESEMELVFASLHQLCAPLLGALERLPPPQRDALAVAFGLALGSPPDRFLVGLAILTLLSEAAQKRPLICIVDDAQWLDEASAGTLAFVARRLFAESVGLFFAARSVPGDLRGLPELEVFGLQNGEARALLRSALPFPLDETVRERIVAETKGNPLALLQLPRGLTVTELAGGFGMLNAPRRTLLERLEESFERRLGALSDRARLLLLVAAAEPVGDPLLVWHAGERLGIEPAAGDETDGLITISESVRFRHPLVRSAVYRSAPAGQRRRVHLALAEATDRQADPDRRAWHLAAAAGRPDDDVALELEQSAGRAQARGGIAASAAFLQRAAVLTENPVSRAERALAAAQVSLQAGAFGAVLELLTTAETGPLDEFQRARVALVRGHLSFASGPRSDAASLLLTAAQQLQPFDLQLSRETYLNAWAAAIVSGKYAGPHVLREICHSIRALPARVGQPLPLDLLLDALAQLAIDGYVAAAPALKRAKEAVLDLPAEITIRWGWLAPAPASIMWDDELERAIVARSVQTLRDAGALAALPLQLNGVAQEQAWMGDFAGARATIAESKRVAAVTGSRFADFASLRLEALRGNEENTCALIARVRAQAAEHQSFALSHADWGAAVLYNGLGRYEEAAVAAQRAASPTFEFYVDKRALAELVEAAVRLGQLDVAQSALERLVETTEPAGTDFARGIEARSRALLADGSDADGLYLLAIDVLSRTKLQPEVARAHLLYGEWLRRAGRRVDARRHLRTAHGMFDAIGMEAFAERARRELIVTGERVRKRTPETRDDLTPQEEQIARLARDGLSSPEIGAQLFLSSRTVEWHLRKVYAKRKVGSRRELRAALPQRNRPVRD